MLSQIKAVQPLTVVSRYALDSKRKSFRCHEVQSSSWRKIIKVRGMAACAMCDLKYALITGSGLRPAESRKAVRGCGCRVYHSWLPLSQCRNAAAKFKAAKLTVGTKYSFARSPAQPPGGFRSFIKYAAASRWRFWCQLQIVSTFIHQ